MSRFLVTGAKGGQTLGAAAPNRLEINDFVKNDAHFSLYVQALQSITSKDQGTVDSFFQIAAIHGLPFVPWDGSGDQPSDPNAWGGYCTHGDVLFPTFHRPYMILIEQAIQAEAVKIAATYTVDADRFNKAAKDLRQPYWDWAKNAVPPPEVISLDQVTITGKDGKKKSVPNPLRRYTFHPVDKSFTGRFGVYQTTVRYPRSTTDPHPKEDIDGMKRTLKNNQSQIRTTTYNMLTRVRTWPAFSNHTVGDGGSSSNSLEAIHDNIHVYVGASGHMSNTAVAAFDPIFYLHHAQVDRLLSLWSALHPGVWVTPSTSEDGTWTIPVDAPIDKTTNLTPFWNTQSTYWNSVNVTATAPLGYSYPEFNNLNISDPAAVQTAIGRIVNQLYGGVAFDNIASLSRSLSTAATESKALAAAGGVDEKSSGEAQFNPASVRSFAAVRGDSQNGGAHPDVAQAPLATEHSTDIWEWTARIRVKKYEVGASFSIPIFLGSVPEDPAEWLTCAHYVGAHNAFVNSTAERCANCRTQQNLTLEGFVHLNDAILKYSGLPSLAPNVVEPYLTRELHWRARKVSGEAIELSSLPSLEVAVIATRLGLPPGSMFPVPEETRHCHRITEGRPAGARQAEA